MTIDKFKNHIIDIVEQAKNLKNKYTDELSAPVNYACIFCQNDDELIMFGNLIQTFGTRVKDTPTGILYKITPLMTPAGNLHLVKIRIPDPTRIELGDADFTVNDYLNFKKEVSDKPNFKVIKRPDLEMIELTEDGSKVRVYFSDRPSIPLPTNRSRHLSEIDSLSSLTASSLEITPSLTEH